MKLKYNILHEENADLKSQLDTVQKQSKEYRKFVEKYRELKIKKQQDVTIQAKLVGVLCILKLYSNLTFYAKSAI